MAIISFLTLIALATLARSQSQIPINPPTLTLPSDVVDVECRPEFYPGFQTTSSQYDIPATAFIEATKSFFNSTWYGEDIYATEGTDNSPGSIRFGKVLGVPFAERLVGYFHRPHKLDIQFVLLNASLTLPVSPKPITVGPVYEELIFSSICAETGTYVHMTVNYCTDRPVAAYDAYLNARNDVLVALASKLGAKRFEGSCPLVSKT
ncbi:hypothetical protein M413DRAFT_440626 [Hebeloma cylindrosporum]|uniref:Uncharacterized protein n=1 Tax=Hebeloma cylindrosporum TaxID=76867 RepID=A0A0C3CTC1_HEBCY|nr:hypothetical protein M413DRAFT_440626 [Hebeloma cylindrosporum h7]